MKAVKGFKLANAILVSAMALALTGCDGDDLLSHNPERPDSPAAEVPVTDPDGQRPVTTSLLGNVADGYLVNATVCLDLNTNKICDAGEPTATSLAGGVFTIPGVTQSQIDATPLLVEIEAGKTIDEDYPNTPLTKSYTLSAPAGFTFVSPLTTMIQNLIEEDGITTAAAEEAVKALLGTELGLNTDYIAGKSDSENQAEFEKLHKVAQVAARVIADKMDEFKDQVAAGDFTIEDLSSEILGEVFVVLDEITEQVETAIEAGGEFDLDTIASDISDIIVIDVQPDPDTGPVDPDTSEYVLISSSGAASEINADTVVGEWSTGSQIDAEGNYAGLDAWTLTAGEGWGTVLSLNGGFVGDFTEFDQLSLKIATSGGYDGGYFIKIGTGGTESADIPLAVDDTVTGWQDVAVDLSNYDLSTIEYIAVFASGGTANVSQIHITDLALGQDDSIPVPVLQEYALISSTGAESNINEATEVGEWSTGTQINGTSNYEGLDAWSLTAGSGWGTVLALTGGFDGDFSDFDTLKLKIATSGGYAEGYFVNIKSNGVESGNIALPVSDGSRGWQDAEVDLSGYDLSSIEFIAVFAIGGTENVSQLHIADLALVQLTETDTGTEPEPETVQALEVKKTAAAALVEASYSTTTWATLTTALAMPETTQAEVTAKTAAITTAIAALEETGPVLEEGPNLVVNGDFADSTLSVGPGTYGEWTYTTNTGSVVAIADGVLTADVITLGGQWDTQIFNIVAVSEEGDYIVKWTASSSVERDVLVRIDGIGLNPNGTMSADSDVIAHLTPTPQTFTTYVTGTAFTPDAALKIVIALGDLDGGDDTSVASTVTFDDFYVGTLAEAVAADTAELEAAIATAQVLHDGGADETLKAVYKAAIDAAQLAVNDVNLTQTEADAALAALATATGEFDPSVILDPNNLVVNGNFADSTISVGAGTYGEWTYTTNTGSVVAIADGELTAEITTLGGQWDTQIYNIVAVSGEEEGNYIVKWTASSTVERDVLVRIDGIGLNPNGTMSADSDVIAHLTPTPKTFSTYVTGTAFTPDAALKIVIALGDLDGGDDTSVASTVTFDDFYVGAFEGELPTDTAVLASAITAAQNVVNAAVEGTEVGQYTTSRADLQTVIDEAQLILDDAEATQAQADAAVSALAAAKTTFEAGLVLNLGADVFTNGDFATNDVTGWESWTNNGSTVAYDTGAAVVTVDNTGVVWAFQLFQLPTVETADYFFSFDYTVSEASEIQVEGIGSLISFTATGSGTYTKVASFGAGAPKVNFLLANAPTGAEVTIDNVMLKKVLND